MRAARILTVRPENALVAIAQLCAERDDTAATSSGIPPAPPYTVGARANGPGTLPLPMPMPNAARSPSVSDADEFGDDGDLSTADDASIASAPMHPRRIASTSGAQDGRDGRGRPSLPAVAPQEPRPEVLTPARHPPGFISHQARRSASAGAEPRRVGAFAFPPYANAKPGESSSPRAFQHASSPLQHTYQPQFAELHQRRQQQQRRRSRSRGSSGGESGEEMTPRNANFRMPALASGLVAPVPFIPGMPSPRRERELPPRAQHWRMPLTNRDRAGLAEDLARMRVQEDRTPRAQPPQPPPPTPPSQVPTPTPTRVMVTPPRIEIVPACPTTEPPVTVKAR